MKGPRIVKCKECGKEIETICPTKKFCSKECYSNFCKKESAQKYILKSQIKYKDDPSIPECKICGLHGNHLFSHIPRMHHITIEEYRTLYGSDVKIFSEEYRNKLSENMKGENNPWHGHGSELSPCSKNFKGKTSREDTISKMSKSQKEGGSNTNINYYLKRGYSEEEAKKMISERQKTFSLEKCIEKHGEEKGRQIWQDRQDRWQNTLNSKSDEELERINKAKMMNSKGYSEVSQRLFWKIYESIKDKYEKIYFAQIKDGIRDDRENCFNEYFVRDKETNRIYFLDFYVKDINKVIEFDGDYWHGKTGNIKRELSRNERLKSLGFSILHIKENDYYQDREKVLQECLTFLTK